MLIFLNKNKLFILLSVIYLILNLFNFEYTIDSIYVLLINQLLNLNSNIFIYTIFFFYCNRNNYINIYTYLLLIYLILHNLNDFIGINFIVNENLYALNLNLLNGLFIIHPIFIYLFLVNYIIIASLFNSWSYKYTLIGNTNLVKYLLHSVYLIIKYMYNSTYYISVAIVLGSWWATQELNWGSWWEWDLVEIINLYYLLILIFFLHQNVIFLLKSYSKFINNIIVIFIFIILVRYNLIHSIHNFINSSEFIQFYIYFFIFFFIIYILLLNNYALTSFNFKIYNLLFCLYKYVILLIIFIILYNYLGFDSFNLLNYFKLLFSLYIYLITVFVLMFNIKYINTNFRFYTVLNELLILFFNYKIILQLRILRVLHIFIFVFTFILLIGYINFNFILDSMNIYNYDNCYILIDNIVVYLFELSPSITSYFNTTVDNIFLNYYMHTYNDTIDTINFKTIISTNNLPSWDEKNLVSYYKYSIIYINMFIYYLFMGNYSLIINNIRKIY